jgi:tetratricopeptide (TPR) repeat protein
MPEHSRIEELRRRVQRDPASIAFAQLAEEYRRAGQHGEAVSVCRSGLGVHPGYLSARVTLARALVELSQLAEARSEFETVLASAPDNLAAIRGLAEVHHRQGALHEALAFYRRASTLAPNDPDLDRIVSDLAREVAQTLPGHEEGLLTLEQLARELERQVADQPVVTAGRTSPSVAAPPHVRLSPPIGAAPPSAAFGAAASERARDLQTLASLEHWLVAIHGARAQRLA